MPEPQATGKVRPNTSPPVLNHGESGIPLPALAALAAQCGGGFIPVPGHVITDTKLLAHCMGVSEQTVGATLKAIGYAPPQPGQKQWIDAGELWAHMSNGTKQTGKRRR